MSSRNGKKSLGLRLLWIPGSRKNHPKGRLNATNKHISYSTKQKKSEVWSLGGSKAQQHLLLADPDTTLLDGPSTSGVSPLISAGGATAAAAASHSPQCLESHNSLDRTSEKSILFSNNSPTTPNSSTSTVPLLSPPQSPLEQSLQISTYKSVLPSTTNNITTNTMPAKSHQPIPVIVTATTTDNINEENRFSLLASKDVTTNEFDIYTLPSPPKNNLNSLEDIKNSSETSPSASPDKTSKESEDGSVNSSLFKKKSKSRNKNNNQGDANSIESITEDAVGEKIPSAELDWIDSFFQERKNCEILANPKKRKKHAKERDQLDGVPAKESPTDTSTSEEDDKVVKCLYYTLMCCECSIS